MARSNQAEDEANECQNSNHRNEKFVVCIRRVVLGCLLTLLPPEDARNIPAFPD